MCLTRHSSCHRLDLTKHVVEGAGKLLLDTGKVREFIDGLCIGRIIDNSLHLSAGISGADAKNQDPALLQGGGRCIYVIA